MAPVPAPVQFSTRSFAIPPGLGTANGMDYRQLSRLPETLEEVKLIAAAVAADSSAIFAGTEATKTRALKEDLSTSRYLVFATHGLSLGDIPGLETAGLALALEGSGFKDSVLSVEDISSLRLNANGTYFGPVPLKSRA